MVGKRLLIVGGGPAGMMAALLFARAGVETLVIEKHGNFLRDFRGDTVHPSTLELFDQLGLLGALLACPHDEATTISAIVAGRRLTVADFSRLRTPAKFMALMPQWDFLDFMVAQARQYPCFTLRMDCEAVALTERSGRVTGVETRDGGTIDADLVLMCDGRSSLLRRTGRLPLRDIGAPLDVFWFRLPKLRGPNRTTGMFETGRIIVLIDRGDYWQCAYAFPKGKADAVRARGLDALRADVERAARMLDIDASALSTWDDVKLLRVSLDRLTRWHAPGLLAIGDAAHAMSPVGGIGINLAIQDAVAAANILAGPMAAGEPVDALLRLVQKRRMLPTGVSQGFQRIAHRRVIGRVLAEDAAIINVPLPLRIIDASPLLQGLTARFVGLGVRRERIKSPMAYGY